MSSNVSNSVRIKLTTSVSSSMSSRGRAVEGGLREQPWEKEVMNTPNRTSPFTFIHGVLQKP
jgi:hypothetical protein